MASLVEIGELLQANGTDCLVLDRVEVLLTPRTMVFDAYLDTVRDLMAREGDIGQALHVQRGEEWLRAEPISQKGDAWLVVLLPRTRQHVVCDAERLQSRRDALQDLAASTAREMNDAMTIVQGRLELLMAFALENPESAARHASIALEHSERITSALHNLRLVGSGGLLRFKGLDLDAQLRRALTASLDNPAMVQLDLQPKGMRIVGHEPAVQGVLSGVFRTVMGEDGGLIRARLIGDEVAIECSSKASRHADMDGLPLGIVSALLEALGGRLSFSTAGVVLILPSELEERGWIPEGKAVLAIGQPAFTQAVRSFLEPDTVVRVARTVEGADIHSPDLYGVVTELLLPGLSGLALVQELARDRPQIRTLLVTHDAIRSLPSSLTHLAGPLDRVRLIRALTGG